MGYCKDCVHWNGEDGLHAECTATEYRDPVSGARKWLGCQTYRAFHEDCKMFVDIDKVNEELEKASEVDEPHPYFDEWYGYDEFGQPKES
jgi:hypothetical protein